MAIVGIGTDLVEVPRIHRLLSNKAEFLSRVFTANETAYCQPKPKPEIHFAARFAAKEAFMKAIGTGWAKGVGFDQIEVSTDDDGKPILTITGEAKAYMDNLGATKVWVSLSHTAQHATATVILES